MACRRDPIGGDLRTGGTGPSRRLVRTKRRAPLLVQGALPEDSAWSPTWEPVQWPFTVLLHGRMQGRGRGRQVPGPAPAVVHGIVLYACVRSSRVKATEPLAGTVTVAKPWGLTVTALPVQAAPGRAGAVPLMRSQ